MVEKAAIPTTAGAGATDDIILSGKRVKYKIGGRKPKGMRRRAEDVGGSLSRIKTE